MYCDLTINRVWSVWALFVADSEFFTYAIFILGSYYPRTVELSSPKLNAYKPELGPLLFIAEPYQQKRKNNNQPGLYLISFCVLFFLPGTVFAFGTRSE